MNNNIIDKFFKFIEKDMSTIIKKDLSWLGKTITQNLDKLTKGKELSNKKDE